VLAMRISKEWGRDPGWFETLPREKQINVLAYERVLADDRAAAAKKQKARRR
jgi:hypothetical protein